MSCHCPETNWMDGKSHDAGCPLYQTPPEQQQKGEKVKFETTTSRTDTKVDAISQQKGETMPKFPYTESAKPLPEAVELREAATAHGYRLVPIGETMPKGEGPLTQDQDGNFVTQSKDYATRICKVLKLDWKWPDGKFLYLSDVIQEAMFHVRDKYRKVGQPTASAERTLLEQLHDWKLVDGSADAHTWRKEWLPKIQAALQSVPSSQPPEVSHYEYRAGRGYLEPIMQPSSPHTIADVTVDAPKGIPGWIKVGPSSPPPVCEKCCGTGMFAGLPCQLCAPSDAGQPVEWPECYDFYQLMQIYRHMPVERVADVRAAYEAVKEWLRSVAAPPALEKLRELETTWIARSEMTPSCRNCSLEQCAYEMCADELHDVLTELEPKAPPPRTGQEEQD